VVPARKISNVVDGLPSFLTRHRLNRDGEARADACRRRSRRLSGLRLSMKASVNFFLMGCRGGVPSRRGLAICEFQLMYS
jgi:hypothetical protein